MNVQWYPGHMTKAKRQMQEDIKLIDLIIELVDARVPLSSRNPDIDELGKNKSRLILLNKSDLADERQNEAWKTYFQAKGFYVVKVDSRNGSGMKAINNVIQEACKEKIERDRRRGIKNRPIRAMVVGIPNVGKSTFINTFAGRACAKTGNKPGVTKGKQWIRLNKNVELLDTPGILWPKFEDQAVGLRLALIGSIKEEILNTTEMAIAFIDFLKLRYSIGNPGNQNFSLYMSSNMYSYTTSFNNPFGLGARISSYGNPNLEWQKTIDQNFGFDVEIFHRRLRLNFDYFMKNTDPLLVSVTLPTSTGTASVPTNLGKQTTKGYTLSANVVVLQKEELNWSINGLSLIHISEPTRRS